MKKARVILGVLCLITLIGGGIYFFRSQKEEDNESPVLKAETESITVSINATDQELIEGITAVDNKDGDVSDSILIENIEKKQDGANNEFLITYVAFDSSNNHGSLTRTLFYEDYVKPHFVLNQLLRFPDNKKVSLLDYFKAEDCLDGDITPFITLEADDALLQDKLQRGFYEIKLSVTNSVGDTAEVPFEVDIYENSYEEQSRRPEIVLKQYITYIKQGEGLDTKAYLDHIEDKGVKLIDYTAVDVDSWEYEKLKEDTSKVHISRIRTESNVDSNVPGVYSVLYSYVSETTGYDCRTRMSVVVE